MSDITRFTIDVDGASWPLARLDHAEEPRILDIELAKRLGYARPAKIRELIERLMNEGILSRSEVFPTAGKTSPRGGRPGTEFWLTEEQAVIVTTQSKTETAIAMLKTVVHVFRLAAHGQLPGQLTADDIRAILAEDRARMETRLGLIEGKLSAVATTVTSASAEITVLQQRGNATMAPSEQNRLEKLRRKLAQLLVDVDHKKPRAAWRIVQNLIQDAAEWCGKTADLPLDKYQKACRALELRIRELEETADAKSQPPLPFSN